MSMESFNSTPKNKAETSQEDQEESRVYDNLHDDPIYQLFKEEGLNRFIQLYPVKAKGYVKKWKEFAAKNPDVIGMNNYQWGHWSVMHDAFEMTKYRNIVEAIYRMEDLQRDNLSHINQEQPKPVIDSDVQNNINPEPLNPIAESEIEAPSTSPDSQVENEKEMSQSVENADTKMEEVSQPEAEQHPLDKNHSAYRKLVDELEDLYQRMIPLSNPVYSERFNKFLIEYPELAEALPQQMERIRNLIPEGELKSNSEKREADRELEEKDEMRFQMLRYLERAGTQIEALSKLFNEREREGYTELMDFRDLRSLYQNLEDLKDTIRKDNIKDAQYALFGMSKALEKYGPVTRGQIREDERSLRYVEGALRDIQEEIVNFSKVYPERNDDDFDWMSSAAHAVIKDLEEAQQKTAHFERKIAAYLRR